MIIMFNSPANFTCLKLLSEYFKQSKCVSSWAQENLVPNRICMTSIMSYLEAMHIHMAI